MFGTIKVLNETAHIPSFQKNKVITDAKTFRKMKFFNLDSDFLFHKISSPKKSWKKTYFRKSDKRDFKFP